MKNVVKKTQDKDAEREFFSVFGKKRSYDVFDNRGYDRIIGEFFKYFQPRRGLKIADLGCGTGAFTAKFLKYGFEIYGVDISPECIEYAAKRYPEISFEVGDIAKTGYRDETFDIVFLSGVLHHFQNLSTVIGECYRILKKDGILLGYDPNMQNPFMRIFRCKDSPFYVSRGVTENERPLNKKQVIPVLTECGFSELKVYSIGGVTYKYIDHIASSLILPIYNFMERLLCAWPWWERFGPILITYAKKGRLPVYG